LLATKILATFYNFDTIIFPYQYLGKYPMKDKNELLLKLTQLHDMWCQISIDKVPDDKFDLVNQLNRAFIKADQLFFASKEISQETCGYIGELINGIERDLTEISRNRCVLRAKM